jgi:phosphoglycerate dehydrogenase-like enzyme
MCPSGSHDRRQPVRLDGITVGIVGFGVIGRATATDSIAAGCRILLLRSGHHHAWWRPQRRRIEARGLSLDQPCCREPTW